MTLEKRLATYALRACPERAATVLEKLEESEAIALLRSADPASVAEIVQRLSPSLSRAALVGLGPERAAAVVDAVPLEAAIRLARRVDAAAREPIFDRLEQPRRAQSLRAVLRFAPGTAGALMDPEVPALPQELSSREALSRLRREPDLASDSLYVVDQGQVLVGVLSLSELLGASGSRSLAELMTRDPHRVASGADRAAIVAHAGWRETHSLPVVDRGDVYLGAIRYRALRDLEDELRAPRGRDADAAAAFGEVIAAGARALVVAFLDEARREETNG